MECQKVVVVGVDGGTWDLIKPWAEKNELPAFKFLLKKGSWGVLESTIPPVNGPAWVSFCTGKNPGKHGIFDFVKIENNSLKLVTSKDVKDLTIYDILSRKGFRNIIISLPLSYPPKEGFNGVMVSDFLYPKGIEILPDSKKEYIRNYRLVTDFTMKEKEKIVEEEVEIAKVRTQVAKEIYLKESWDFYFFYFHETDFICHHFWSDIKKETNIGKKAKEVFQIVDNFLSWLLSNIDERTILFVMSDHGFSDSPNIIRLNKIFMKKKLLKVRIVPRSETDESLSRHFIENLLNKRIERKIVRIPKFFFKFASNPVIKPVSKKIFRTLFGGAESSYTTKIDFTNSKAFVPTLESMGVYVKEQNKKQKEKTYKRD